MHGTLTFPTSDNSIENTLTFFQKGRPNPGQGHWSVQTGCHFEEVSEMIEELQGTTIQADEVLAQALYGVKQLAAFMKTHHHQILLPEENRIGFIDAMCDQIVTGTGSAYCAAMDIVGALDTVNDSNLSKFDEDGNPIYDANGKITKGPNYFKADLSPFI